jgi:hypothetical protein
MHRTDPDPQHFLICSMLCFVFQGAYLRLAPGDNQNPDEPARSGGLH